MKESNVIYAGKSFWLNPQTGAKPITRDDFDNLIEAGSIKLRMLKEELNSRCAVERLEHLKKLIDQKMKTGNIECFFSHCDEYRQDGNNEVCFMKGLSGTTTECGVKYFWQVEIDDIPEKFSIDWTLENLNSLGYIPGHFENL